MFFVNEHFAPTKRAKTALFSPDGVYRLALGRTWDSSLPRLYVVMVNPSDGDAEIDDPTILRLCFFARLWGYGGLGIGNLFALVSSDPKALDGHPDPGGSGNTATLLYMLDRAVSEGSFVLVAWGNNGSRLGKDRWFIRLAIELGAKLMCLGLTQHGHPKHPMARGIHRIPDDFTPIPFEPPWWGSVKIGHITVPLHPDGRPVCLRCDGGGSLAGKCRRCGGTGEEPNPFGDTA